MMEGQMAQTLDLEGHLGQHTCSWGFSCAFRKMRMDVLPFLEGYVESM